MARCPNCSGYLRVEPQFLENPMRIVCIACSWSMSDPNFRKEEPRYFPSHRMDKMIGWMEQNSGYDLYYPRSAAAQLGISESFFRYSVKADSSAPVIMGRGMIACNTATLQAWWDGKNHHG